VRGETEHLFMLPEEVERDDCGEDVRRELCWMYLVKQEQRDALRKVVVTP